jgi:hypothetical protein
MTTLPDLEPALPVLGTRDAGDGMVQTHSGLQWSDPAPATTSQQPALTEETWPAHGSVEELIRLLKDCDAEGSPHYANEHMQRASAALTSLSAERDELRLNLSRKTANVRDLARRKGVASEYRDGFKAKASELEDENDGLRLELDLEIHARKMAEAEATSLRRRLEEAYEQMDEIYEECAGVAVPARDTAFEAVEVYRSTIRLLHARAADRTRRTFGASE